MQFLQKTNSKSNFTNNFYRSRKKLGDAPCPETVLYEGHECPCGTAHAQLPGIWSSCIMTEDTKQSSEILSNQPPPPIGAWDLRFGYNV